MPRPVNYKAQSIVYFEGDVSNKIFVLKEGRVAVNYRDIETGKELQEVIQRGEFFGVKSALGRYPREESVTAITDCIVLVFSVEEFESFAASNSRVVMKMLKVFSNQLRRVHSKVRALLSLDAQMGAEQGLINTAEYYQRHNLNSQAVYAFQRYLELYPQGKYLDRAKEGLQSCSRRAGSESSAPAPAASEGAEEQEVDVSKRYYAAVRFLEKKEYEKAFENYSWVAKNGKEEEFRNNSMVEMGRCLFQMQRYKDTVQHLSQVVQKYPGIPGVGQALLCIADSYHEMENIDKAKAFYQRILSLEGIEEDIKKKAQDALHRSEDTV